jgi:hypothetical protein
VMEFLLGGARRIVILGFAYELGHASMLFGLVDDGSACESEDVAQTGLAGFAFVCLVSVGKACKLETVVRAPPTSCACR